MALTCSICDRRFVATRALRQHLRDSPVHNTTFDCGKCDRVFRTEQALQQHIRDSPTHPTTFDYSAYDRALNTEQALQQHVHDLPARIHGGATEKAERSFDMRPSLHRHVSKRLRQYGLSFKFSPDDNPHDFLKDFDSSVEGVFTCHNGSCPNSRWTSKKIAITIRLLQGLRYNARVYYQRCKSCGFLSRPKLARSYAERVSYRLAKWSGIPVQAAHTSGRSERPHETEFCEGCRHGRCPQTRD